MALGDEWLNDEPEPGDQSQPKPIKLNRYPFTTDKDKLKIEKCIDQLKEKGIDITADYDDWIKIGFALVPLGEDGRTYFHEISELWPGYKYNDTEDKWKNFVKTYNGRTTISTIFYYFKLAGVNIKKAAEDAGIKSNFPYEVFHPELRETILKANECLNINIDYLSTAILTVVSGIIGNTYNAKVKDSWREPSIIFSAIVGTSGFGKSPALDFAMNPLKSRQVDEYNKYKESKKDWDQAVDARKSDKNAPSPGEHPKFKQIFFSDATPEAINDIHNNNKNGLILFLDELSAWFNSFNQYRKGADEEFWLSVFSNKMSTINRVSKAPIIIEKPHICVLGGIQPKLIRELAKGSRLDNGFLYRILFAYPDYKQKMLWKEEKMPDDLVDKYNNVINSIYHHVYNKGGDTESVSFTEDAHKVWKDYYNDVGEAVYAELDEGKEAMYSKMISYLPRLALALQVINQYYDGELYITEISEHSTRGALALVDYYRASFEKVYGMIYQDAPENVYDVADMVRAGKSYSDISEELNISKGTISKWKKKYVSLFQ